MNTEESTSADDASAIYTGATPIIEPGELLESQRRILKRIIVQVRQLAIAEVLDESKYSGRDAVQRYRRRQLQRRPHNVFLVDGARGSGKTTLILTIQQYLRVLGRPEKWVGGSKKGILNLLKGLTREIHSDLSAAPPASHPELVRAFDFEDAHRAGGTERRTAFYLPVLFPSDLEPGQSVMEGVLALMAHTLERLMATPETTDASAAVSLNKEHSTERADTARRLRDHINEKVAKGWFLSKNTGHDAILRDSVDYLEYLKMRGEANVASFERVTTWREFVNEYLDFFGAELLAVFFDDTDVSPDTTRDILHTIRIFLDHPRIVTVIAGNLRSMRQAMLLEGMKQLGDPIDALKQESETTARDWRQFLRQEIEESLEKVLPRQYRHYITLDTDGRTASSESPKGYGEEVTASQRTDARPGSTKPSKGSGDAVTASLPTWSERDFKKVFGVPLDALCGEMLNDRRDDFLILKHRAHFRQLVDWQPIAGDRETSELESYIAWWLFRHAYAEELRPRTIRHLSTLRAFTRLIPDSRRVSDHMPMEHKKRLAVILFETPENYALIHRLGDLDTRVLQWLHRQSLASSWRQDRFIIISGRRIFERTYSYNYLLFRLDLGIAMPVQENPDEGLPQGILPLPSGPNLVGLRPFFPRMLRQRQYGVAKGIQHTAIPDNCIYFSDLSALPDVSWADADERKEAGPWGAQIIYNWPNYFFFDVNELSEGESSPDAKHSYAPTFDGFVPERWVREYFTNVVLPFSSIGVGRFVRSPNNHADALNWDVGRAKTETLLHAELGLEDTTGVTSKQDVFFAGMRDAMDTIRRRYDYMDSISVSPMESRSVAAMAEAELQRWRRRVLDHLFPPPQGTSTHAPSAEPSAEELARAKLLRKHLASYQWLTNDARRAWHAGRIFLNQTSEALRKASERTRARDRLLKDTYEIARKETFFRTDRYVVPTSTTLTRWLERSDAFRNFQDAYRFYQPALTQLVRHDEASLSLFHVPEVQPVLRDKLGIHRVNDVFEPLEGWLPRKLSSDIQMLISHERGAKSDNQHPAVLLFTTEDLAAFLRSPSPKRRRIKPEVDWPLWIDPGLHDEDDPALSHQEQVDQTRINSRVARSFLYFLYGLSPTLPSLIHMEIASNLYAARDGESTRLKASCDKVLNSWERRAFDFLHFVQNYRRVLEIAKCRLDIMTLCRQAFRDDKSSLQLLGITKLIPAEFGVRLTLTPDADHSSLGIRGLNAFRPSSKNEPIRLRFGERDENLSSLLGAIDARFVALCNEQIDVDPHNARVKWRPVVDCTVKNLIETLNFIHVTRVNISEWEARNRPTGPVRD